MMTTCATIVNAVFSFPHIPAATTTPSFAVTSRRPDTINSRATIIITGTEPITPRSTMHISAETTSTLSARGSRNFPKVVTRLLLRAMCPSSASVAEAAANIARAITGLKGTMSVSIKNT